MVIGRRDVLRVGAVAAAAWAASACSPTRDPATSRTPTTTTSRAPSAVASPRGGALALQPQAGHLYYGASVPHYRSLEQWEGELGHSLAVNRSFFTPTRHQPRQLVECCLDDIAHDRLSHVSMKPQGTWRDIASGAQDTWLEALIGPLRETGRPILFTMHHEPENDAGAPGMLPADFVAMQRHLIEVAARGPSRVVVVPVLQQWTFDPVRTDIDPAAWLVPEATVMGLDVYNHWSPTNGQPWRSFGSKADEALSWLGDTPIAIGEYGCREDPENPGLAAEWLRDAATYAREHAIISMSYYNSRINAPEGSWELGGSTEQAFAEMLASDWVARPA